MLSPVLIPKEVFVYSPKVPDYLQKHTHKYIHPSCVRAKKACILGVHWELVMGLSPGPARARPGPVHFSRDRARNFEKGPSSTQARDRFLEKGLENWDFYVVKNTGSSRLGIELL